MKIFFHYVYVLSFKGTPFYVGISTNPVKRLYLHKNCPYMRKWFKMAKNVSEICINIVGHVQTKSIATCKKCYSIERFWIEYYHNQGFDLLNIVSKPPKRYIEQMVTEHVTPSPTGK